MYFSTSSSHVPFTNRPTAEKDVAPDDSVSRGEHDTMREHLEGEVNHLTHLLQEALRKQDEMALEAADAWQKVGGDVHFPNALFSVTFSTICS